MQSDRGEPVTIEPDAVVDHVINQQVVAAIGPKSNHAVEVVERDARARIVVDGLGRRRGRKQQSAPPARAASARGRHEGERRPLGLRRPWARHCRSAWPSGDVPASGRTRQYVHVRRAWWLLDRTGEGQDARRNGTAGPDRSGHLGYSVTTRCVCEAVLGRCAGSVESNTSAASPACSGQARPASSNEPPSVSSERNRSVVTFSRKARDGVNNRRSSYRQCSLRSANPAASASTGGRSLGGSLPQIEAADPAGAGSPSRFGPL